jgi:hypothetical protein
MPSGRPMSFWRLWKTLSIRNRWIAIRRTMTIKVETIDRLLSDRVLKGSGIGLFVLWLGSWGYTASKMLVFSTHTYRNVTLPVSILCLNLWAICFALSALRRFTPEKSHVQAASNRRSPIAKRLALVTWWVPFGFAASLGLLYVVTLLSFRSTHLSSPSPALPAEVTFAPMVFFFAFSSKRTRLFQDSLFSRFLPPSDSSVS